VLNVRAKRCEICLQLSKGRVRGGTVELTLEVTNATSGTKPTDAESHGQGTGNCKGNGGYKGVY
jgi:hypothetical protein